jgi:predicted O-methyltransferase YrrM
MRRIRRRLRFGLSTLLGGPTRGFFIPYRYAASVLPQDYPALMPLFDAARPRFEAVLDQIDAFASDLASIPQRERQARFDQDWFPRLDAAAAYTIVRMVKPKRILEIGSGHSTRFMAQAVKDESLAAAMTCIDPSPRASLEHLAVTHVPALFGDEQVSLVEALEAGDILFVDSSHIAMPGTDVDRVFLDVLPRLAPGVLVHVHDVTLPYAYPLRWAWRGYNEQSLVGALLQGSGYELYFASHFALRKMDAAERKGLRGLPILPEAVEASLWLLKR